MRLKLTCFLLLLLPGLGIAQPPRQVLNTGGFDLLSANLVVTSSVGEPAILTFTTDQFILTQGFLQPEVLPCTGLVLDYYPNPAIEEIVIEATGCDAKIMSIDIHDAWGRKITSALPDKDKKVKLGDLSSGIYFFKISFSSVPSQTIKVAKVSP